MMDLTHTFGALFLWDFPIVRLAPDGCCFLASSAHAPSRVVGTFAGKREINCVIRITFALPLEKTSAGVSNRRSVGGKQNI